MSKIEYLEADGCMGLQKVQVRTIPLDTPRIVCLCGSTRFKEVFIRANFLETRAGRIVLTVGWFSHADGDEWTPTKEDKEAFDRLHIHKIDLADEVLVIDVPCRVCPKCQTVWRHDFIKIQKCGCGEEIGNVPSAPYIGESTRREITHATRTGKPIRYLSEMMRGT